jgi:hypothetical protein
VQSITIPNTQFANPGAGTPSISALPLALHASPVDFKTPYNTEWDLDIQHELRRNLVIDVGYYGSKGTHLLGIADINMPQPGVAFADGITTGNGLNQIRPFLGYGPINTLLTGFDSNYNALQATANWHFGKNSLVGVAYTWSKALTDAQTDRNSAPQNVYNIAAEYGPSQLDRRQVLTANYIYDLPFFGNRHDVLGYVAGGWELSGLVTANSGLPLTAFTTGVDPGGLGVALAAEAASGRPDLIGNPNDAPKTLLQWFNTAAFAAVPAGQHRPGNEGRGTIVGPGFSRWDVALMKNIPVHGEAMHFQFRAEAFNVFNHTNFNTVGTTLGLSSFGQVTSTRDPRIMQVALKFYF